MLAAKDVKPVILIHEGSAKLAELMLKSAVATGNDVSGWRYLSTDRTSIPSMRGWEMGHFGSAGPHPDPVNRAVRWLFQEAHERKFNPLILDADCTILRPKLIDQFVFQLNRGGGMAALSPVWQPQHIKREDGDYDAVKNFGWTVSSGLGLYRHEIFVKLNGIIENLNAIDPWDVQIGPWLYPNLLTPFDGFPQFAIDNATNLEMIPKPAHLHHGCKDGSLQKIVTSNG